MTLLKIAGLMGFVYILNAVILFRINLKDIPVDNKRDLRNISTVQSSARTLLQRPPADEERIQSLRTGDGLQRLPRVLAIVFPQFHRDPLNDKLWGDGFTDWDNLRAAPLQNRLGFDIPRPTELGYYDLTNSTVRRLQGDLAHEYGIDGFVYHHYWFYDETHRGPNLHQPLVEMLKDGHPNVSFFLNWCASKWVDTWSGRTNSNNSSNTNKGQGNNVLQMQFFPDPDDPAVRVHYDWLKQFFHHPNYIKVSGQPVLMLYQKKPRAMPILQKFREMAVADGFPGLYILVGMSKTHDDLFPEGINEGQRFNRFPPNLVNRTVAYPNPMDITSKKVLTVPKWCLQQPIPAGHKPGSQVTGILTSFDNTPRRDFETATLWSADEPDAVVERFSKSLHAVIYYETCCFPSHYHNRKVIKSDGTDGDERLILINSMNEWAESMAMEPSDVFGRRFLQAVRDVKSDVAASGCAFPELDVTTTRL